MWASCHCSTGAWERGKCGYKLIQYMAAGRPTVASAVGASNSIVVPGETGFLADSMKTNGSRPWPPTASVRRARGSRHAEAMYSLEVSAARLAGVLRDALSRA